MRLLRALGGLGVRVWLFAALLVGIDTIVWMMVTGSAHANPMCGPGNGPMGYLWPNVQMCQLYTPGLGGMARVPALKAPQNVPYPQNNYAVPGWPIQMNPQIPGGPYSPGG